MSFDFAPVLAFLPALLAGLVVTLQLTVLSLLLGNAVGLGLALARLSGRRLVSVPALVYIEFFRTTPLYVQLIWIFFVLPVAMRALIPGSDLDAFAAGVLALGLNTAAYMAEIFRAGILGVDRGQWDAAHVLGLSRAAAFRFVVLPQAIKIVVPPTAAQTMLVLKGTAIVAGISVAELTYKGNLVAVPTGRFIEVWTVVAIIYFIVIFPIGIVSGRIERRFRASERGHQASI